MNWQEWVTGGTGGGLIALVYFVFQWIQTGPKTKAETGKANAETGKLEVDTQDVVIDNLSKEVERLSKKADDQDKKIAVQEKRIADQDQKIADQSAKIADQERRIASLEPLRTALAVLTAWVHRAWTAMTPDQQASVGQPPDYQHLLTQKEG